MSYLRNIRLVFMVRFSNKLFVRRLSLILSIKIILLICFLKKFSDWTWDQEKRLGKREDPKYVTCRRYKRVQAKNGQQVCIYKGANSTYTLVVEGQCPSEYRCKYDPHGSEPNIDSVVDSLNDKFKK